MNISILKVCFIIRERMFVPRRDISGTTASSKSVTLKLAPRWQWLYVEWLFTLLFEMKNGTLPIILHCK